MPGSACDGRVGIGVVGDSLLGLGGAGLSVWTFDGFRCSGRLRRARLAGRGRERTARYRSPVRNRISPLSRCSTTTLVPGRRPWASCCGICQRRFAKRIVKSRAMTRSAIACGRPASISSISGSLSARAMIVSVVPSALISSHGCTELSHCASSPQRRPPRPARAPEPPVATLGSTAVLATHGSRPRHARPRTAAAAGENGVASPPSSPPLPTPSPIPRTPASAPRSDLSPSVPNPSAPLPDQVSRSPTTEHGPKEDISTALKGDISTAVRQDVLPADFARHFGRNVADKLCERGAPGQFRRPCTRHTAGEPCHQVDRGQRSCPRPANRTGAIFPANELASSART